MSYRLALFVALLLFLLPGAVRAQAPEEGILLGFRYQEPIPRVPPYYAGRADSLARPAYHTLLIVRRGGRIALVNDTDGLLVPRSTGFWHVDTKRSIYNDWVEDFIWAAPLGRIPQLPGIQAYNGEYCRGNRVQKILYAGDKYLALEQQSGGYCEGAAHPWVFNTLAFVPLDSTTHIGLYISEVLGDEGRQALTTAAGNYLDALPDEEQRALYTDAPDEANWGLTRKAGRWILQGRLDGAGQVAQGVYADLELPMAPPQSLAGRNQLTPSWTRIKAFAPDAVDAFTSPGQGLLLIVHRNRLTVHPLDGDQIGTAGLTLPLRPGARPVMARWAVGPRVQRWVERVSRSTPTTSAARH